jgi:S1-C subfamily serine protease
LAVGYPFSLNTTVTAGIISAESRHNNRLGLTILKVTPLQARILQLNLLFKLMQQLIPEIAEALVNTNGELIGINSAIASQTGSYAGYSFAPVNLAKKILDDLKSMVP